MKQDWRQSQRQGTEREREAREDNWVRKRSRWTHTHTKNLPQTSCSSDQLWKAISPHDPLALHSSGRVCHQVDHIHCCPTVALCQLAVCSEVVNTRVSIFHHTLTLSQADKRLFRNKAQLNPQVSGRIIEPGMIGLFSFKISVSITPRWILPIHYLTMIFFFYIFDCNKMSVTSVWHTLQ